MRRLALRDFVKSLPGQPSRDQQRDLCLRRAQLRDDLSSFQALQQVHMPLLGPTPSTDDYQLHAGEDYGLPEEDPLCMPSAWPSSADRERLGFAHLVDREAALRRAQADRALARMRVSIQTWNSVLTFGHQNVAGQRQGTRLQNRLASHRKDIDKAANAYRRHYDALNSLGLSTEDAQRYRPLTEADLRNLHVKASKPAGLGESQLKPPWFWGTDRDADERSAKDLDSLDALTKEGTRYAAHAYRFINTRWAAQRLVYAGSVRGRTETDFARRSTYCTPNWSAHTECLRPWARTGACSAKATPLWQLRTRCRKALLLPRVHPSTRQRNCRSSAPAVARMRKSRRRSIDSGRNRRREASRRRRICSRTGRPQSARWTVWRNQVRVAAEPR